MNSFVIETTNLTKRFGKKYAVQQLNLHVPRGSVFAFLGRNGAGKTTTIRLLMNLLEKSSGSATILGLDCARKDFALRAHVGYVAQNEDMYDWMTVEEMIWFCKGFYQTWNSALVDEMLNKLQLPRKAKIRSLSRGMQTQLALILALAFQPELLILDEPTAGLDVVVRREFMESIIGMIQEEGRTIFYSSHLIHEVERLADWVGIIDNGHLVICAPIDEVKQSIKRVLTHFPTGVDPLQLPGVLSCETAGSETACYVSNYTPQSQQAFLAVGAGEITVEDMGLEDIFVALTGKAGA